MLKWLVIISYDSAQFAGLESVRITAFSRNADFLMCQGRHFGSIRKDTPTPDYVRATVGSPDAFYLT